MNQKKESVVLLLSLLITSSVIAVGLWWFWNNRKSSDISNSGGTTEVVTPDPVDNSDSSSKLSTGNEILLPKGSTPEKEAAAKAIANKDYTTAESFLQQSLSKQPNDPEALIYLNNARIADSKSYTIAVPVPIETESTTAQEILRGVAQAQDEINQGEGINNIPLKVGIIDDRNDSETAEKIAQTLVNNPDILGVVGHFSSDVTLATAPIYQENKLVAISPTSTSIAISMEGNYIFRTVPSDRFTSNALAGYFLDQLQLNRAVLIYNSQSAYSRSLQETFTVNLANRGGEIVMEVDLSQSNFNPAEILKTAATQEADALVFLNDSTTVDKAYLLMQLNDRKLPQLAGDSLYKPQTLQIAGEKAQGLVVGVPWHAQGATNTVFSGAARRLWKGDVNWRTAMAYDATKVLAEGLASNPSRLGIQQTLSQSGFNLLGATGNIRFFQSGDRNNAVQLVEVQPGTSSSFGYDFVPLK